MNHYKITCILLAIYLLTFNTFTLASNEKREVVASENVYTEDKPNIVVSANHPIFVLKLKSNPTTGYSWFLRDYDNNLMTPLKHHFEKSEENLMGAPGYEFWTFRVKPNAFIVPTQTIIRMVYTRPWQSTDSSTQIAFHVMIEKK